MLSAGTAELPRDRNRVRNYDYSTTTALSFKNKGLFSQNQLLSS